MAQLAQPRSHLQNRVGMLIRSKIYKAFPTVPPRELDSWELWQIGVRLDHDMGAVPSDDELAELADLRATRAERLRRAATRGKESR